MSERNSDKFVAAPEGAPLPESQSDRWIKYGSNVVLSVVLAIVLGVLVMWFAQRSKLKWREDMTANGSLSLKPQTVNVVKDLKQHVTLVSLYVRPDNAPEQATQAQNVADLLDEYKGKSDKIDVKVIDPLKEKDKLEELHQEFISRYGSQIKSYKDYLEDWNAQYERLKKLIDAQVKATEPFGNNGQGGGEDSPTASFVNTIDDMSERLNRAKEGVTHELNKKHPDYKAAAAAVKEQVDYIAQISTQVIQKAPAWEQSPQVPEDFKKYLVSSAPQYQEMKQIADDVTAKGGKLGELKIDKLEQALNVENPILVLGADDWRILSQRQVWQDDTDIKALNAGAKVTPRFAGEQQVTTALYSLENPKKQKLCFVRGGGPPVTPVGFPPFIPGGPMSTLAERLREYNFDILEKDLSGQWAMQAQMRQMPSAPEPTDEQMKDAVWVVLDLPQQQQEQGPPPPSPIGPRLKAHLAEGGSALVLADIHGDPLLDVLKEWGVELHPEAVALHETIKLTDASAADFIEAAKAQPYVWDCRDYGEHLLVKPLKNFDSVFVAPIVVRTNAAPGCEVTPLLPLSANMEGLKTWGQVDLETIDKTTPEYHPEKGDLAPPIFAGAAVEKKGAGRLVVIGSYRSLTNGFMRVVDPRLARRDPPIRVNRFPGNAELATNSVFWLAHLEPMIAISPSAMDVSRLGDMSNTTLNFLRIGVLLILLPGAVLAAGAMVYMARRD